MTTERALWPWLAAGLPLLLVLWVAILAAVARISGAAPAYYVPLPSQAFFEALPPDVRLASQARGGVVLQSDAPGLVAQLYESGAALVLPAGLPSCVNFTRDLAARGG